MHVLIEMTFFFDPACPGGGLGAATDHVQVYILLWPTSSWFSLFKMLLHRETKTLLDREATGLSTAVPFVSGEEGQLPQCLPRLAARNGVFLSNERDNL